MLVIRSFETEIRHFILSLRKFGGDDDSQCRTKKYQNDRRSVALCINVEDNGSEEVDGWGTDRSQCQRTGILPGRLRVTSPSILADFSFLLPLTCLNMVKKHLSVGKTK